MSVTGFRADRCGHPSPRCAGRYWVVWARLKIGEGLSAYGRSVMNGTFLKCTDVRINQCTFAKVSGQAGQFADPRIAQPKTRALKRWIYEGVWRREMIIPQPTAATMGCTPKGRSARVSGRQRRGEQNLRKARQNKV